MERCDLTRKPLVSLEEFIGIVEGKNTHPTLHELHDLSRRPAEGAVDENIEQVRRHLQECAQCSMVFEAMKKAGS